MERPRRLATVVAVVLLVFLYVRSPIDLIPDVAGPVGLLDDLVVVAFAIWWLRRFWRETQQPRARRRSHNRTGPGRARMPGEAEAGWDPHRVLGVAHGASPDELTRAYRDQMKLYHPDRVADLGAELQQLAHRKALEIQRAYEELSAAAGPAGSGGRA